MHSPLLLSVLATGLLLTEAVAAIPDFLRMFPRADDICKPPPTPKVQWIDFATLEKLTALKLPLAVNGTIQLKGYRPKGARVVFNPKTIQFKDPYIDLFQKIAPNSTQLFMRKSVDFGDRIEYPYNLMGKVIMRSGPQPDTCTGTLVGTRIFITANHCVSKRDAGWSLEFVPGYDGTRTGRLPDDQPWGKPIFSKECFGIRNGNVATSDTILDGRDYVVCLLEKTLPTDIGFLGANVRFDDAGYKGRTWISAGYPGNFQDGKVLTLEDRVMIQSTQKTDDNGLTLVADPYVDHGWSGGPLFGIDQNGGDEMAFMIAVVSATRTISVNDNMFISSLHSGGYRMGILLQFARCRWGLTDDELDGCRRS